jgi:hypothetical protein
VNRFGPDVICAGMYRACSTWQYEVAAHLIEEHCGGKRLGYLVSGEYSAQLRDDALKQKAGSRERRGWRVIKAHEGEPSMARELRAGGACALYTHRDVRDVVFSLMHKRSQTFEQIVRQGMVHQILANDRFWMAQPNVLVQRYEDLISDPARGVVELANHLGFALEAGKAERIAADYSQESNRARMEALKQKLEQAGVDLENAGNTQIFDPSSLLHWNHMRQKGAPSWRTTATPRQIAVLRRLCGRWLAARGYSLDGQPARRRDLLKGGLRESLRSEMDVAVGFVNFLVRTTSLRFPKTARTVKRLLRMPVETNAGATVWADPIPTRSAPAASQVSGDAA